MKIYALGGIQTREPSNLAVVHLRFRRHGTGVGPIFFVGVQNELCRLIYGDFQLIADRELRTAIKKLFLRVRHAMFDPMKIRKMSLNEASLSITAEEKSTL